MTVGNSEGMKKKKPKTSNICRSASIVTFEKKAGKVEARLKPTRRKISQVGLINSIMGYAKKKKKKEYFSS